MAFDAKKVWQKLGVAEGTLNRVKDLYNLEVPSQLTHDNKLLVETNVIPGGVAKFNVVQAHLARLPTIQTASCMRGAWMTLHGRTISALIVLMVQLCNVQERRLLVLTYG